MLMPVSPNNEKHTVDGTDGQNQRAEMRRSLRLRTVCLKSSYLNSNYEAQPFVSSVSLVSQ